MTSFVWADRISKLMMRRARFLKVTQAIQRKEKEIAAIAAKMEDEQTLGGKMHKQVKELSVSEEVRRSLLG